MPHILLYHTPANKGEEYPTLVHTIDRNLLLAKKSKVTNFMYTKDA